MVVSLGDIQGVMVMRRTPCLHSETVSKTKPNQSKTITKPLLAHVNLQQLGHGVSLLVKTLKTS